MLRTQASLLSQCHRLKICPFPSHRPWFPYTTYVRKSLQNHTAQKITTEDTTTKDHLQVYDKLSLTPSAEIHTDCPKKLKLLGNAEFNHLTIILFSNRLSTMNLARFSSNQAWYTFWWLLSDNWDCRYYNGTKHLFFFWNPIHFAKVNYFHIITTLFKASFGSSSQNCTF